MSVLNPKEAVKFIAKVPGAAARIARKPREKVEVYESRGFHGYYE